MSYRDSGELSVVSRIGDMNEAALEELYCQFGKRFLDGFSWLAPLTNNRLGDALNIEFVHEQLFFIQGNRVLDNVGYSEKGARFNEAQFGTDSLSRGFRAERLLAGGAAFSSRRGPRGAGGARGWVLLFFFQQSMPGLGGPPEAPHRTGRKDARFRAAWRRAGSV